MRNRRLLHAWVWLLALLAVGACSEAFNDLEMHLGLESKTRPLAILCEPPEAAPGDTVLVTLWLYTPDPAGLTVSWRVALDYDLGPYGTEEIERRLAPLAPPAPVDEGQGFLRQEFRFVVPDSTLLWASALADPLDDAAMVALAAVLLPPGTPSPPAKAAVDAYLAGLTAAELAGAPAATQAAAWGLADRFAGRVRFRAAVAADVYVEVTRNLTIRHSGRLGSPNTNRNPEYEDFEILVIPHPDVPFIDRERYADELLHFPFAAGEELPWQQLPRRADWTYYLTVTPLRQAYTSPYSGEQQFAERSSYRWYYVALDDPQDAYPLFRDEDGDATEMWALVRSVRLLPPAADGDRRYRLICCLRDSRPEWDHYGGTPGLTLLQGEATFAPPAEPGDAN